MKVIKNIFTLLICVVLCFSLCISTFATNDTAKITVSSVDAMPGDSVTINIDISNNPGIMAMAFCITYDKDALIYKNFSKGYLTSYTVKDHSDKGYVSFVNVENKDKDTDGTIISILFEVKADAAPGKHVITLANSNIDRHGKKLHNSFSTSKQEFVIPIVTSGGITVAETCENAGHNYTEWNIVYPATCTSEGLKNRLCERCSTFEEETIPASHDFEAEWTVDKVATPNEDGIMSRHCTKCDEVTDQFTFKYEEIVEDEKEPEDTPSNDMSSDENSYVSSENSSNTDSDNTSPDNISSNPAKPQKPNINNTVGEKVPLEEVEKFEDYEQIMKPDTNNSATENDNSSDATPDSSDITTGAIPNNNSTPTNEKPSFLSTTGGIVTAILGAVLSIGILVLGILLILRNKKSN